MKARRCFVSQLLRERMNEGLLAGTRTAFAAALAVAAFATLTACGGVSKRTDRVSSEPTSITPFVAAFEESPTVANWENLHAQLIKAPIAAPTEARIVGVLVAKPLPRNILDAAAVDLATLDWGGTVELLRKLNVVARSDPSPQGVRMVGDTARLAWLMLTLRANYSIESVDLSYTDLKAGTPSVGQSMNLANVDFSGSELRGTTWRNSNLTDAIFDRTDVAGVLRCTNCTFGTLQYPGTVTLAGGKWVPR
jgi:hypothetical protein